MKSILWIGLDVHAETIAVAVAEGDGPVESLGRIQNNADSLAKLVRKLRKKHRELRACYEAGPCGYVLCRDLTARGVSCQVVAPTLIPQMPGDRVKTDRRDAKKLATLFRSGLLTPVWVPDAEHEAFRELVRARQNAVADRTRARNRLGKFLLRHGRRKPARMKSWGVKHCAWLETQKFDHSASEVVFVELQREIQCVAERVRDLEAKIVELLPSLAPEIQQAVAALQALKGVALVTAATVVAEVGDLTRFAKPSQLMSYSGCVPSESSSGAKHSKGRITKAGNPRLRRVLVEAAWQYRTRPSLGRPLRLRQEGLSPEVKQIAWSAQKRLHDRYRRLTGKGKDSRKVAVAVGRELLGFIWAIGQQVAAEMASSDPLERAA